MLNSPQNYPRLVVVIGIYCLAIRIYLDFSGYTDMAIGIAKLFGYEIMENFNFEQFKNKFKINKAK